MKRSSGFYKNAKELATQMTETLDKLVGVNYDSRIRPNYGGKPVQVELNMAVTGMVNTTFQIHRIDKVISTMHFFQIIKFIILLILFQGPVDEKTQVCIICNYAYMIFLKKEEIFSDYFFIDTSFFVF